MINTQRTVTEMTKEKKKKGYRKLQDLTMKDNFMFGAVMSDPENCKGLLERILHIKIDRIEIDVEKSMVYHPVFKGVRLDVYAKDIANTHYNVEMQTVKQEDIGKRSRYYHSQIDMELLKAGQLYQELSDSYVIFICDFDPFDQKKYCYTFQSICQETRQAELKDGRTTIFLSTHGENEKETTEELVKFLKFVKADAENCMKDFEDDYVKRLQQSMYRIKRDRETGERYMSIELYLQDERRRARQEGEAEGRREGEAKGRREGEAKGRQEGRISGRIDALFHILQAREMLSEKIKKKIQSETTEEKIDHWIQLAATAGTQEEFEEKMDL